MAQDKQKPDSKDPAMQGEGNYDAARRYDEKLREHVQQHDVEREAREAKPDDAAQEREMERAEQTGKRRAKEEDRLLDNPEGIPAEDGQAGAGKGGGKSGR